jgi:hypothetical protein
MNQFRWHTNLRCPFSRMDKAFLDHLQDYKIGAPQRALGEDGQPIESGLTLQELHDFNVVGVYTTEEAIRRPNPDKISQQAARKVLTVDYQPLEGHLSKYVDERGFWTGRQ